MYKLNSDGTVVLDSNYRVLWSVFRHTNGNSYLRRNLPTCIKSHEYEAIEIPCNQIVELPENVETQITSDGKVSIYSLNLRTNRLEIACSTKNEFLYNVNLKNIIIGPEHRYIFIIGNNKITASFSDYIHKNLELSGTLCLCKCGKKKPIISINKLRNSDHYIETVYPEFAVLQYYIAKTYEITSLPVPDINEDDPMNISCSGSMLFDSLNTSLWSLTSGKYKTAKTIDGKHEGLKLPSRQCNVSFEIAILVEGETPVFQAYLKYKTDPDIYYTHQDITGKDCIEKVTLDNGVYKSPVWKIPKKCHSNAILYIEINNYSPDTTNLDAYSYSLNIE